MKVNQRGEGGILILASIVIISLIIVGIMAGIPKYNVYSSRLSGEAALAKADSVKKVLVTQAQAEKDAAVLRADAINIVGQAAKDFPEYREQEFIGAFAEAMQNGAIEKIIYVPTEANIPIIEARQPSEPSNSTK